jgi:hypothetical protein
MIKYKLTGELKIELQDENDYSPKGKLGITYPINISGLGYNFNHFVEKRNELQNVIKEFIDRGTN